jgi:hypothetical protein
MERFPESRWAVLVDDQEIVGHVGLTFRIWYEEDAWQGICPELGVPSFGDAPGEALDGVIDATLAYLNEIEDTCERERIFAERGIALRAGEPASKEPEVSEKMAAGESVSRIEFGLKAVA